MNPATAQLIVDNVNLNEREDIMYVQLQYRVIGYKNETRISVDFGQSIKLTKYRKNNIYSHDGTIIEFKSVIGALNHLEKNGWSLFAIDNKISGGGDSSISTNAKYLFRRKEKK
jgi:hypothetical protein